MSKIRIYELAKELGVDNKIVLNKAVELGLKGKSSHSSSLDSDEADQVRRAVIRQAIGQPGTSETITKRVDRVTGATEAVVERRAGNVIRRRKASDGPEGAPAESQSISLAATSHAPSAACSEEVVSVSEPTIAEVASTSVEPVIETAQELRNGHTSHAAHAEPEVEVEPEVVEPEPAEAEVEEVVPVAEESKKATVGPRVLGKIELPQKKVVKIESARKATGVFANQGAQAQRVAVEDDEDDDRKDKKGKPKKKREFSRVDLVDYDGGDVRRVRPGGKSSGKDRNGAPAIAQTEITQPKASKRVVKMDEAITVGELAKQMSVKAGEVIQRLMNLGILATINQSLDHDTTAILVEDFGFTIESVSFDETKILEHKETEDPDKLKTRPPVVTVMGHVDHGKTSLLDYIKKTTVVDSEHGGITQHIGAYSVTVGDKSITFIDTPGHAAFTAMRARGAQVTDIVILVVAADDGVMPQTREAINHAQAAQVPIIIAINKMDKQGANPERIKQQLTELGLQPEDWGGDTLYFPVSALKGTGIKELLEGVLLVAELREFKANPDKSARGSIIETKVERGRGTVATVLVQSGTLRAGDIFVSGSVSGRVRAMTDYSGKRLDEAGPSIPVEITGFDGIPDAGDDFSVVASEAEAREIAMNRAEKIAKEERSLATGPISLEEFARRANNQAAAELNVILKADVNGSVQAVQDSIEKLSNDKVKVRVLHAAVGGISESDIQLAIASRAIVVGFNVRAEPRASADAERAGVQIRFYRIIYELIDDVKQAMAGLLAPIKEEVSIGRAEVRETFTVPKLGTVAGCYVVDGTVKRGAFVRLVRDSRVIHEGKMASLRRFKDDVREVQNGYECGIGIENYNDVKQGDTLEIFEIKETAATLD